MLECRRYLTRQSIKKIKFKDMISVIVIANGRLRRRLFLLLVHKSQLIIFFYSLFYEYIYY